MPAATDTIETTGTAVQLTGDPAVDALLQKFSTSAWFDGTMAYVWGNMVVRPKLDASSKVRKVYAVLGAKFYYEYHLTDLDIAWLARSMWGEGANTREMASVHAWGAFNRFMLNPAFHTGKFKDCFWRYILFFSQPVNPIWRRTGAMCKIGGVHYGQDICSEVRLANRDQKAFSANISAGPLKLAEEFAVGTLESPGEVIIDYGDPGRNFAVLGGKKIGTEVVYPLAALKKAPAGAKFDPYTMWEKILKGTRKTARVIPKIDRPVQPDDTVPRLDTNQLIAYIQDRLAREQNSLLNDSKKKADFSLTASTNMQASADLKGQQIANAVQAVSAAKNAKPPSPAEATKGSDGQQVCSDDTWNYV